MVRWLDRAMVEQETKSDLFEAENGRRHSLGDSADTGAFDRKIAHWVMPQMPTREDAEGRGGVRGAGLPVTTRRRASSASANLSAAFHDPTLTLLDGPSAAKSPAPSEVFEARNAAPRAPPLPCPGAARGEPEPRRRRASSHPSNRRVEARAARAIALCGPAAVEASVPSRGEKRSAQVIAMVGRVGLEPTTTGLKGRCSNQLS
jgi:hypothetical protein